MASSNGESTSPPQLTIPPFSVREVYKAGWLKGVSFPGERRGVLFGKKCERLWALFCIHDDVQPFLEFYTEPKATPSHQPLWATSLAQCMHISHSIVQADNTFEIVVTCRESAVLRLGTGTWEQMNEWVDVLNNRLRDIGVLEPKENFYSPLPESAKPSTNLSTRDPNSPLPLPPDSREDRTTEQDVLYADTIETAINIGSIEEPVEHVTVISVNEDALEDSTFTESTVSTPPSMFSTRVRIASAPSSLREAVEEEEENRYEAIFNSAIRPSRQLPELPAPAPPPAAAPPPPDHGAVVRTPSHHYQHGQHQRTREGLRRTMSVGQEHQLVTRSIPPPPLLIPAPPLGRGREGLVLLPRPQLFVPAPPPPPHHPLGTRHSSPLFRPTPSNPNAALQPVNATNHGEEGILSFVNVVQHNNLFSFFFGTGGADTGYSLKERQVARLRMEMQHPAGVRIILKKRDCLNTIALIDALGTVWYTLTAIFCS